MPDLLENQGKSPQTDQQSLIEKHPDFFSVFTAVKYYSELKRYFSTSSFQMHERIYTKRVFVVYLKINRN